MGGGNMIKGKCPIWKKSEL